ncbi:MAG: hypothetical protein C4583_01020 [Anaerolineaceae bacterium]|nr:MAG: hypothetical protein C4583_01020 [Anaerolineaceae bacterium]
MKDQIISPSIQDFSLIRTHVQQFSTDLNLSKDALGFMFFAIDIILGLQDDEAEDAITDTSYLKQSNKESGHDRGIDALYIDTSEKPAVVHFFNMKYTEEIKNTAKYFPSGEIDKILGFLSAVITPDEKLAEHINKHLFGKVEEIWELFKSQYPKFVIHICANHYLGLEESERKRFEREVNKYSNFKIEYHLMSDFVSRLTKKGKQIVNAKLRAIDQNLFEKSDGDIRAIVVNVDARELLRIVCDDEQTRQSVDTGDYSVLKKHEVLEDAFDDNVRMYLKQRSKINRNIKETALSEEAYRFFYFNNGITITCSHFEYPKKVRNPIIDLENLQIVNGSQTIHALFDAYSENDENFEHIDILCRIYETNKEELSVSIAEYTNSQNPVKSRDIRSNDYIQKKLEKELLALGYYYERKKGQYVGKPKVKRLDAEKVGQALFAFINKMPAEAKNDKKLIFADKYEEVFSDLITADTVLTVMRLFNEIEFKKANKKNLILENPQTYDDESFILYATHYLLYVISELADKKSISKTQESHTQLIHLYDDAITLLKQAIQEEKSLLGIKEKYVHGVFFKSNKPKLHIQKLLRKL